MPLTIGDQLQDRYQVQSLIGEGGVSLVYQALDILENRQVAVKILKHHKTSRRAEDLIRFRREAKAVAGLEHPNLIRTFGLGEAQGNPYIVMEWFPGQGLDQWLEAKAPQPSSLILDWMLQLAGVLDYVHQAGILHRDVKPSNILVRKHELKLVDFGMAQVMEWPEMSDQAAVVGTFSYMSPEQAGLIRKPIDERSDLYSLGIVFYQVLTHELPFKAGDLAGLLHQQIAKSPQALRQLNPRVSPLLEEIVLKLLRKDPEERYQSASGLAQDLRRFQEGEASFVLGQSDRLKKLNYHTRLVGREAELRLLQNAYQQACFGQGGACLISGEAGRGKSRLVEEMARFILTRNGLWLTGRCFDQENKIPYQPFVDALNEYLKMLEQTPGPRREDIVRRLRQNVGGLGEVICRLNPLMRSLLGDGPELVPLDPEKENRRFLMVCSQFFRQLGTPGQPLVLVLDDLQWSDEGSLSLLEEILGDLANSHFLLLGTFRDNEVSETHRLSKIMAAAPGQAQPLTLLPLASLDLAGTNRLVSEMLQDDPAHTLALAEHVFKSTAGNPFFAMEVIRNLFQEKVLAYRQEAPSGWQVQWDRLHAMAISKTILDILMKRIDLLTPEQAGLLSVGAVIGRKFPLRLLFALCDKPADKIIFLVDECVDLQLLERGLERGNILFVHDRIKEAFYQRLPEAEKRRLHGKIATALEALHESDPEAVVFELAHHYSEAGEDEPALRFALPAAAKARVEYANEEAESYYRIALAILERTGQARGPAWMVAKEGLAAICDTLGRSEEVIALVRELLPLKPAALDKARLLRQIGTAYFKQGDWRSSEAHLREGLRMLGERLPASRLGLLAALVREALGFMWRTPLRRRRMLTPAQPANPEDSEIIKNLLALGWSYVLSDALKYVAASFRVMTLCETRIGRSRELGVAYSGLGGLWMFAPWFRLAHHYLGRSLQLRKDLRDEPGVAQSYQFLGYTCCWQGDYVASLDFFRESLERYRRIGDRWEVGMSTQGMGHCQFYQADYAAALKSFETFVEIGRRNKDYYTLSDGELWFCYIYTEQGRYDQAAEHGKAALAISEAHQIHYITCCALVHLGYLETERRDWSQARIYLERARAMFEKNLFLRNYTVYLYPYLAVCVLGAAIQDGQKDPGTIRRVKHLGRMALRHTRPWPNHRPLALRVQAEIHAWLGRHRQAEAFFLRSLQEAERLGRPFETAKTCSAYGRFLAGRGRPAAAAQFEQRAQRLLQDIGSPGCQVCAPPEGQEELQATLSNKLELLCIVNAGHYLSAILELDLLLEKIMDVSLEVTGSERGFLFLYPEAKHAERKLQIKVARNLEKAEYVSDEFAVSRTIIHRVEEGRKPLAIVDAGQDDELSQHQSVVRYGLRSILCLPLIAKRELLGVIYLDNRLVSGLFTEDKIKLLTMLFNQAAISIENARLYQEVREKTRMEEDLRLGRQIQMKLLPRSLPAAQGLKVRGLMEPAKEIGGDYYDVFLTGKEDPGTGPHLAVVIGDVTGKGVAAGLVMAAAKAVLHSVSRQGLSPREVLIQANTIMSQYLDGEKLMTVAYLDWEPGRKRFRHASAGHEPILLCRRRPEGVDVTALKCQGIFLGLSGIEASIYEESEFQAASGDKILMYTDGVTDALNPREEQYGQERLLESVRRHAGKDLDAFLAALRQDLHTFIAGQEAFDDITLVAMEVL